MAIKFIGKDSSPNYLALSTDIGLDGSLAGAAIIGGTVYLTDVGAWRIITSDLKLVKFDGPGVNTAILLSLSPSLSSSKSPSVSPSLSSSKSPSLSSSISPSVSPS